MKKTLKGLAVGVLMAGLSLVWSSSGWDAGVPAVAAATPQRPERIAPEYQGEFDVEVLIDGVRQEKLAGRGRNYVEAVKGAEYALRIRNPLPVRVAVALSVDGLNTIDARRTSARDASKWVIPPYQSITVGGWQMSGSRARRFYFTTEPDSYAAKMNRPSDIGVISAVFFRERREVTEITPPPLSRRDSGNRAEESRSKQAPPAAASEGAGNAEQSRDRAIAPAPDDDYAATGIGRSVNNDVYRVHLDLESRPVAVLNIRYEYRPELVRLGLLPRHQYPKPDPLRRRERAKGFAERDFCPEP